MLEKCLEIVYNGNIKRERIASTLPCVAYEYIYSSKYIQQWAKFGIKFKKPFQPCAVDGFLYVYYLIIATTSIANAIIKDNAS